MGKNFSLNLTGKIKNYTLPKNKPLMPLFETVINSIHAIEERRKIDSSFLDAQIDIQAIRMSELEFGESDRMPIQSFKIFDNGIGFTEENMKSFLESDSTYKANIGGKGVGRFSWLKAFSSVSISSEYSEAGIFRKRDFVFSKDKSYIDDILIDSSMKNYKTCVFLNTYQDKYAEQVPKKLDQIAIRIIQHCLVNFIDDNCPQIIISDKCDKIVLNDMFKNIIKINTEIFTIEDQNFNLLNVKVEDSTFPGNRLYVCANSRLVYSKDLQKFISDLDRRLFELSGFFYIGILTSTYLDTNVDMNRLSFDIPEKETTLFGEITQESILKKSCSLIEQYLKEYLSPIAKDKKNRIIEYVTKQAPQYRHLLKHKPDQIAKIKPNLTDEQLDDALYAIKREYNKESRNERNDLIDQLKNDEVTQSHYDILFRSQVEKIIDENSAVLAEYVTHRKVVIDLFELGLRKMSDGKFNKEKYMHELIYPLRATSEETDYKSHNLWLIDEKLSYCSLIVSDIPFDNDPKQERPDILIMDNNSPLNNPVAVSDSKNDGTVFDTVVIFELKRPDRNDYSESDNPIVQLLNYVEKLRSGSVKDKNSRRINVNDTTKLYLYAVCDLTKSLEKIVKNRDFSKTPDGLGYYFYSKNINAYFEVLSYDKILNDAKKRNRVFFEKLELIK
jgi:hypothetical protein